MKFDESIGVKILLTVGFIACYVLMCCFWETLDSKYHKIIFTTIITGYALLYITLTVAVICEAEVEQRFNRIFSMYGVGAYLGIAAACFLIFFDEEEQKGRNYYLAAGAVATLQAFFLTIEVFILFSDRRRLKVVLPSKVPSEDPSKRTLTGVPTSPQQGAPISSQQGAQPGPMAVKI